MAHLDFKRESLATLQGRQPMCRAALMFLFASFVSLAAFGASPPAAKSPNEDHWRYAYFNGDWWYWLPENRWVYWRNGQ